MRSSKFDEALILPTGVAGCRRHVGELAVGTAGRGTPQRPQEAARVVMGGWGQRSRRGPLVGPRCCQWAPLL
jgi:hypothetical protein